MKLSLDIHVINNDQAALDSIEAALPLSTDDGVWPEEYSGPIQGIDDDGNKYVSASIRFDDEVTRSAVEDVVTGLSGVLVGCEIGSYIKLHDCNHDGSGACANTLVYEVV